MKHENPLFTVVLAEDDDGQASLIQRNLVRAGITSPIVRVRDGREALDYFDGPGASPERASVLVLDIRMPNVDGIEVLRRLKSNDNTCQIPIYMLSTTDDRHEIERCFRLGCNAYITKPVAYDAFMDAIRGLAGFLKIAAVPGDAQEQPE